jgi:hypothetical protein
MGYTYRNKEKNVRINMCLETLNSCVIAEGVKVKVKISLSQAMEAHRVARG